MKYTSRDLPKNNNDKTERYILKDSYVSDVCNSGKKKVNRNDHREGTDYINSGT